MRWVVEKRLWVDDNTSDKINILLKIGRGFINREKLLDAIIYEWIRRGCPIDFGILCFNTDGNADIIKRQFIYFKITESLWNNFNNVDCNLNINVKFKIAVDYFYKEYNDYQNLLRYIIDMRNMI